MNAGMHGMPDGNVGVRKVIAQTGRVASGAGDPWSPVNFGLAGYTNAAAMPIGVRTAVYSADGKGAARFFSVYFSSVSSINTIEVEVDGVVISSTNLTTSTAGSRAVVGAQVSAGGAAASMALDYIPFGSSFRVFVTPTALIGIGVCSWSYLMEAHQ